MLVCFRETKPVRVCGGGCFKTKAISQLVVLVVIACELQPWRDSTSGVFTQSVLFNVKKLVISAFPISIWFCLFAFVFAVCASD